MITSINIITIILFLHNSDVVFTIFVVPNDFFKDYDLEKIPIKKSFLIIVSYTRNFFYIHIDAYFINRVFIPKYR